MGGIIIMFEVGPVPDIFRIADMKMRKMYPPDPNRPPRRVPMPKIDSNPNIRGPLSVTKIFKEAWARDKAQELETRKRKEELQKRKTRREYERKIIDQLTKKARLESKLSSLDPTKAKDMKRITNINFQLKDIEDILEDLQKESGIDLKKLDTGSTLLRFWNKVKKFFSTVYKKIKKFFKKHFDTILKVCFVIIPGIIALFARKAIVPEQPLPLPPS